MRRKLAISEALRVGVTRYLQLYTVLAHALAAGEFPASRALPSEPELVKRYGVSRTTVRRALARLEREGRIVRRRGSGTFARRAARTIEVRCPCCGQSVRSTRPLAYPAKVRRQ